MELKRETDKSTVIVGMLHTPFILTNKYTKAESRVPDHLTCLLRNLYADQEATIRTGRGTTDWFQIGKGEGKGCIMSPCLFNLYAEYIMWSVGLDEAQSGIKIARKNINKLSYADDITLMAESKELKSLLMKVKEESEKVGSKLSTQKTKIMASGPITSCWRRLLRVSWTSRRSIQSILKEVSPEYSLEELMLKLKLQYFGHLMGRTD